jgi:hypothetical protein
MITLGVYSFCGDSARAGHTTTECVPLGSGAHEVLGSSERPERSHTQCNHPYAFVPTPIPSE